MYAVSSFFPDHAQVSRGAPRAACGCACAGRSRGVVVRRSDAPAGGVLVRIAARGERLRPPAARVCRVSDSRERWNADTRAVAAWRPASRVVSRTSAAGGDRHPAYAPARGDAAVRAGPRRSEAVADAGGRDHGGAGGGGDAGWDGGRVGTPPSRRLSERRPAAVSRWRLVALPRCVNSELTAARTPVPVSRTTRVPSARRTFLRR